MTNKNNLLISVGLLSIMVLSTLIYFGINTWVVHVLLAISFVAIGAGILLGFIKMVSDEKN
ncbi:hypothetical protein MNBD_GAMMA05-243 [hydrothermal vent metagenome]|uniref:Uncharacterized protein n=1 Tax=hydrothermal vent metagenome TaxID=652676 RepID=A0A3B0WR74_9ZZZZ